jgi:glycosyltransferase involved in cell wall biosynthesis
MRICLLSDFKTTGGAAVAADRLASAFAENGHETHRITSEHSPSDSSSSLCDHILFLGRKHLLWQGVCTLTGKPHWSLKSKRSEEIRQLRRLLGQIRPHLINVHNLHGADWSIELVETCLAYAPVIWTLHDCWSFLGKYYPTHTPTWDTKVQKHMNSFWERMSATSIQNRNLAAATPSAWMAKQSTASFWKNYPVQTIANTHPLETFHPISQHSARDSLGIAGSGPWVLVVAGDLSEERKGGPIIKKILESAASLDCHFLLVGSSAPEFEKMAKVRHLGFVRDDRLMALIYAAADLTLHTAPVDNLPNTIAESLCCGTPVLAFSIGGIPEMITPNESGWLVKEINADAMRKQLVAILQSKDYENLRGSARETARDLFDSEKVAQNYMDHFHSANGR